MKVKNEVASKEIDLKVAQRELERITEKDKAIEQYVNLLREKENSISELKAQIQGMTKQKQNALC